MKKVIDISLIKVKPKKPEEKLPFLKKKEIKVPGMEDGPEDMHDESPEEQEGPDESEMGLESAAEDIMKAFEDKDVKALVEGLKNFFVQIDHDEPEEDDESEKEESDEGESDMGGAPAGFENDSY